MMDNKQEQNCSRCCEPISPKRWALLYRECLDCGDKRAKRLAQSRTIVPMHKSNYILVTDLNLLKGLNK